MVPMKVAPEVALALPLLVPALCAMTRGVNVTLFNYTYTGVMVWSLFGDDPGMQLPKRARQPQLAASPK